MNTAQHPQPTPPLSASHRRKFVVLAILASIIIILLWIATLPFNFKSQQNGGPAGPAEVYTAIESQVSAGADAISATTHIGD